MNSTATNGATKASAAANGSVRRSSVTARTSALEAPAGGEPGPRDDDELAARDTTTATTSTLEAAGAADSAVTESTGAESEPASSSASTGIAAESSAPESSAPGSSAPGSSTPESATPEAARAKPVATNVREGMRQRPRSSDSGQVLPYTEPAEPEPAPVDLAALGLGTVQSIDRSANADSSPPVVPMAPTDVDEVDPRDDRPDDDRPDGVGYDPTAPSVRLLDPPPRRAASVPGQARPVGTASVGAILLAARQAVGLSQDEVCRRTRIRIPVLRQMERDDFSRCGGEVYARGHLRHLARVYGLDSDELLARYTQQRASARQHQLPRRSLPNIGAPTTAQAGKGLLAGLKVKRRKTPKKARKQAPPNRAVASSLVPSGLAVRATKGGRGGSTGRRVVRDQRGPNWTAVMGAALAVLVLALVLQHFGHGNGGGTPSARTTPTNQNAGATVPSTVPSAPPSSQASKPKPSNAPLIVQISAVPDKSSWLQVTSTTGQSLYSNLLAAGQSQQFSDNQKLVMRIGNAAAVRLVINGRDIGPLGTDGQVVTITVGPGAPPLSSQLQG
jgi:cytoskeleton protein RodZ